MESVNANGNVNENSDRELAKFLYHRLMSNMKYVLDLEEYSYKDAGRSDPRFKFFKKQLMSNTYGMMEDIFETLAEWGVCEKVNYEENLINGYRESPSGGSSYLNTPDFNYWLEGDVTEEEPEDEPT